MSLPSALRPATRALLALALLALLPACGSSPVSLVRVDDEPPGEACPEGGVVLRSGVDTNGSGVLELAEIQQNRYLCKGGSGDTPTATDEATSTATGTDGSTGGARLVQVETAGAECPDGGVVVRAGVDADGDGLLAAGEVQETQTVCVDPLPTAINGSVVVHDSDDLRRLRRCTQISGDLRIEAPGLSTLSDLEQLTTIGGQLIVQGGAFDTVRLPALTRVTGALRIAESPALVTVDLSQLTQTGGLSIDAAQGQLTTVTLPRLSTVGGGLAITAPRLTTLDLSQLGSTTGDLTLTGGDDAGLTAVDLPRLASVGRSLAIRQLPALLSVSAPLLATSHGVALESLGPTRTTPTTTVKLQLSLPALTQVDGPLALESLPSLDRLSLPVLQRVEGPLALRQLGTPRAVVQGRLRVNDNVLQLSLPALTRVGGDLLLEELPTLHDLSAAGDGLALPLLQTVVGVVTLDTLGASLFSSALDLTLPALTTARSLKMSGCLAFALKLPALTALQALELTDNGQLRTLVAPLAQPSVSYGEYNDQLAHWCVVTSDVASGLSLAGPRGGTLTTETAQCGCGNLDDPPPECP